MSLEDIEDLDDPIQLVGFDGHNNSEYYKTIDLTTCEEDEYIPQQSKNTADLPVAFHVTEPEQYRQVAIKVVDCNKHPWYYKKYMKNIKTPVEIQRSDKDSKITVNHQESMKENKEETEKVAKMVDNKKDIVKKVDIKIRPVATPYRQLKVGDKIKQPTQLSETNKIEIEKRIFQQAKSEPKPAIDLKKNVGLIGLKITQTNEKILEKRKNKKPQDKAKTVKNSKTETEFATKKSSNVDSENIKKKELDMPTLDGQSVSSALFPTAAKEQLKSVCNPIKDSRKELKKRSKTPSKANMENKIVKNKEATKNPSEAVATVQKWVEKRKIMNILKSEANSHRLEFSKILKNLKNKQIINNDKKEVIDENIKKQDDAEQANNAKSKHEKGNRFVASRSLEVKNTDDPKDIVSAVVVCSNNNYQLNPGVMQIQNSGGNHESEPKPGKNVNGPVVGNSQLGSYYIERSNKPEPTLVDSIISDMMDQETKLPTSEPPQNFTPRNIQVSGNIARMTMAISDVCSKQNTQSAISSHLISQTTTQVPDQKFSTPPASKPVCNNNLKVHDNLAKKTVGRKNFTQPKMTARPAPSCLPNQGVAQPNQPYKSPTTSTVPLLQRPGAINDIQVSGNVARVTMPVSDVYPGQHTPVPASTQAVHNKNNMSTKVSAKPAMQSPAVPHALNQTQNPNILSEAESAIRTGNYQNVYPKPMADGRLSMNINDLARICNNNGSLGYNYQINPIQASAMYSQQYAHNPNILRQNETNKACKPNMPEAGVPMPYLTSVAPVNQPRNNYSLNQNQPFRIETVIRNRDNYQHSITNEYSQRPVLLQNQQYLAPNQKPPYLNYMHCSPMYEGPPRNVGNHAPYTVWSNCYPPPPRPPPPPYSHIREQLNRPTRTITTVPPANVTTGATIIGENISGPIRKINLVAVPDDEDERKRKSVPDKVSDKPQGADAPSVTPKDDTPVDSKKEMLDELSKAIGIDSTPPSPLLQDIRNTTGTAGKTKSTNSLPIHSKPGPLSKKPKLQLKKSAQMAPKPTAHKGYSPPILPIPSFKQSYEMFHQNVIDHNLQIHSRNTYPCTRIADKFDKGQSDSDDLNDKSVKKISLRDYRQRVETSEEKGKKEIEDVTLNKEMLNGPFDKHIRVS